LSPFWAPTWAIPAPISPAPNTVIRSTLDPWVSDAPDEPEADAMPRARGRIRPAVRAGMVVEVEADMAEDDRRADRRGESMVSVMCSGEREESWGKEEEGGRGTGPNRFKQ
jgi:hypothetical protein